MDYLLTKADWKFALIRHGQLCAVVALEFKRVGLSVDS